MKICPHCEAKLRKRTKYCPECGAALVWEDDTQSRGTGKREKTVIIVLSLLLIIVSFVAFLAIRESGWIEGIARMEHEIETEITTEPTLAFLDDPEAIADMSQSVVLLKCFDKSGEPYSTGSGFACFEDNVIVTNYHVIEGGVYSIHVKTESGYTYFADTILAVDEQKDLAILQTNKSHNLKLLKLDESSKLEKGEDVVAIGSPLGLLNSVSTGVFSGQANENGISIYQFTAPISSGSSGGALFNSNGDVVGVTFASYSEGQNLNLAIPAKYVSRLYEKRGNPVSVSNWFESNNGWESYLENSTPVNYQDLLNTPERYHQTIVSVPVYVAYTSKDGLYVLPSRENITWEGEPRVTEWGKEWVGYVDFYLFTTFKATKMIDCEDNTDGGGFDVYLGQTVVVTGWFEYSNSRATIKLLHISE